MASFLVEAYTPSPAVADAEARAREAAADLARDGTHVRYIRAVFVPADEICFHFFEAPSADVVREVSERARLAPQRILEASDRSLEPMEGEMRTKPAGIARTPRR